MDAEVIILPVIVVARPPFDPAAGPVDRRGVTDLNAWRYQRERRMAERRELSSLLGEEAG